jgi:hypothetical protein
MVLPSMLDNIDGTYLTVIGKVCANACGMLKLRGALNIGSDCISGGELLLPT